MSALLLFSFWFVVSLIIGVMAIAFFRRFSAKPVPPSKFVIREGVLYAEAWNGQLTPVNPALLPEHVRSQYRRIAFRQWTEERESLGNPPRNIGNDWLRHAF